MIRNRKFLAYSLCATLGLLSTSGSANAACALAGTWHLFAMQGKTPEIKSKVTIVRNSTDTGGTNILAFPIDLAPDVVPYQNGTSKAIKCVLTVAANGNFTGSCKAFGVVGGSSGSPTVSGNLALAACNLTGTFNVSGDATPVTIRGGHINGVSGAGIATQGPKQVLSFTLIKN